MTAPLRTLGLDEARPGMALAEDAVDPAGAVRLPRGALLDDQAIQSLRTWGIGRIAVAGADAEAQPTAAGLAQIQARLDLLFRRCRGQPASEALLQGVIRYRAGESQ